MAAMASGTSGRNRRRYGWSTPRWKDRAFWFAVTLTLVLVAVQALLVTDRANVMSWFGLALQAAVTWLLVSAIIRIRRGLPRGLVDGFSEAEAKAAAKPSGTSAPESLARTSGRTVGRMVGAYKRAQHNRHDQQDGKAG